jgi:hypothetical protein
MIWDYAGMMTLSYQVFHHLNLLDLPICAIFSAHFTYLNIYSIEF